MRATKGALVPSSSASGAPNSAARPESVAMRPVAASISQATRPPARSASLARAAPAASAASARLSSVMSCCTPRTRTRTGSPVAGSRSISPRLEIHLSSPVSARRMRNA